MLRLRLSSALALAIGFTAVVRLAAQPSPRPLRHADFDGWRTIATPLLSPDGRWLAYSFMPQDGDGELILREIATGREHHVPAGALPIPVALPADENTNPEAPPPVRNIRIAFTGDSQFALASTHPTKADVTAARRAKKKPEEMPKGGLVMLNLASGEVTRVADVKSFQVPSKGGSWVAYLKEPKPEDRKPDDAKSTPPAESSPGETPAAPAAGAASASGTSNVNPTASPETPSGTTSPSIENPGVNATPRASAAPGVDGVTAASGDPLPAAARKAPLQPITSAESRAPDDVEATVELSERAGSVSAAEWTRVTDADDNGGLSEGRDRAEDLTEDAAAPRRAAATATAPAGATPAATFGTELVLRNLAAKTERTFAAVSDYSFARDGRTLLYAVNARTPTQNGVYHVTPGDESAPVALLSGRGRYSRLAWDREQRQAVFVSDRDKPGTPAVARFSLFLWQRGAAVAQPVVTPATVGLPGTLVVSNNAPASFSRDGKKLFVATAVPPKAPRPVSAPALADEEKVTADLWHWRDGYVQPMQKVRATIERNRTYRGALDLADQQYVQLAHPTLAVVTTSDDGTRVLGFDDRSYRAAVDYDGRFQDVYVVNSKTGDRRLVLSKLRAESGSVLSWSPDGRWVAFYSDRLWRVMDTASGDVQPFVVKSRVAFHNEEADRPEPPGSYGAVGWTKDSTAFLVNDRFDVWQLFPDGRPGRNVTAGLGRAQKIQLRVQRIEPVDEDDEERGLDPAKPLVLRGESEETRASGFFRTTLSASTAPERLLWADKNYRYAGRARDADVLIVTATRFDEYPDVQVTDANFTSPRKLTDGGAQLASFAWGKSELIRFRNADGVPLQATLYTPPGFDPAKKYPLIVYLYERLSQNVHGFVTPAPGTNINVSFYVSNGYCVLMPDIVYKTGRPGPSALACVLPALDAVVARGFVNERAVGIQGHSWGGYQIAYMLTQTDRFRAAEAGAPVGNMTSAYSGIRWGSGLPRQFQYETGQSRIGRSLQAAPKLFLENSPIFQIERVQTPLLIMANDNDDAVPWYQGIELFLALRRHGKPAWLFNYNGEYHGLRRRPNQKDWSRRLQQFFDHHLKGAPAPQWMEEGIPYLERDEEKERFNAPTPVAVPAADR